MNDVWLQDEAVRYKEILGKKEGFEIWLKKRISEDERQIDIKLPPIPKYEPKKIKFTLAGAVGLAGTMIKSLTP
jgi:hypothetical protein